MLSEPLKSQYYEVAFSGYCACIKINNEGGVSDWNWTLILLSIMHHSRGVIKWFCGIRHQVAFVDADVIESA